MSTKMIEYLEVLVAVCLLLEEFCPTLIVSIFLNVGWFSLVDKYVALHLINFFQASGEFHLASTINNVNKARHNIVSSIYKGVCFWKEPVIGQK